jgi:hypothetical protein
LFPGARGGRRDWIPDLEGFTEHPLPDVEFVVLALSVGNASNPAYPLFSSAKWDSSGLDLLREPHDFI